MKTENINFASMITISTLVLNKTRKIKPINWKAIYIR